ncbi:hypothetical protein HIM_01608 [Hirsutella minnesotensis 3608]|nr:hypothetical protein HIM_01608 [Hirsutella minnesotensis 3608]
MADADASPKLSATYAAPSSEHFHISKTIPAPPSDGVDDKMQYLKTLRRAVEESQAQINKELTLRMEQDKTRDAAAGNKAAGTNVDEDKEEENYGEEVQEED